MDLDALRTRWVEQDRKLDAALSLGRALLDSRRLDRAHSALQRHVRGLWIEALSTLLLVGALGAYLYTRHAQPRFAVPAAVLDVLAVAVLADLIRQIVAARAIDHTQPITQMQKSLERLRVLRIRHAQGVLLLSAFAWVPLLIVSFDAALGLDVWRTLDLPWIVTNLVLGLAVVPIAIGLSKRYADRVERSATLQRVMRDLAGHHLNAARAFLAEVAEFEEPPR